MRRSLILLNFENLVNLFFIFFISTLSIFLHQFVNFPNFAWKEGLLNGLLMIGVLGYEIVTLFLMYYYITKTKNKIAKFFEDNPRKFYVYLVVMLGVSYVLINTIIERSILTFFRDIILVGLIIVALPIVNNYLEKKNNKNETKNKI